MPHGVAGHLGIDLADYDERIRTFIPRYDEMLDAAAAVLVGAASVPRILDVGIGTGALASRCLDVRPRAILHGIDGDAEMLAAAAARLRRRAPQLTLVTGDFEDAPLPRADAIVASLSLHHVPTSRRKARFYARAFDSLARGGVLVSADCMPAADSQLAAAQHAEWRAHMRRSYDARTVARYFRAWGQEDVYMPLPRELSLVASAGFAVEVVWRKGAFATIVGRK